MATMSSQPSEPDGPFDMHYYLTEGLEDEEHQRYRDVHSFTSAIDLRTEKLRSGNADEYLTPYLVFSHVKQQQLVTIQGARDSNYKTLRFFYLRSLRALIVKIMPGEAHELAIWEFGKVFDRKLVSVGMGNALKSIGSTTYYGIEGQSQKEADASFKPRGARNWKSDWPTMILECGVTQSPQCLKAVAHWWADNSVGEVNIVLTFIVSETARTIRIMYWETNTIPNPHVSQERPNPTIVRVAIENTIHIDANSITTIREKGEVVPGGTLSLDFKKLFLRDPVQGAGEANIDLNEEDLRTFYERTWSDMD